MKRLWLVFLMLAILAISAKAEANEDCRILSVENVATDTWQIKLSLADLPAGEFFFNGQESVNGPWVHYPASIVNGVGVVTIKWPAGDLIEFSYGTVVNGVEHWTDPTCSKFFFNGHFRRQLGEKRPPVVLPGVLMLLNKKHTPPPPKPIVHTCAVVSVRESNVNGDKADYSITLSLQKFTDAPASAVPYVSRQQAPNSAWTGFQAVTRQGDTALLTVTGWPRGKAMEFAYKLVADGTNHWQNIPAWQTNSCTAVYNDHFRVTLGN